MLDADEQGAALVERADEAAGVLAEEEAVDVVKTTDVVKSEAASESLSWQERAESAEQKLAEVAVKLGEVEQSAIELQAAMESQRSGRLLDVLLLRAGVSDLDAARGAILERLEAEGATELDEIEAQVRGLMAERPGLFGAGGHGTSGVMRSRGMGALTEAQRAAAEAKSSGDRRQLLRYLRLRRSDS